MAKFGDNYHRSAPAAKVATFLSGQTMNIVGTSTNITAYTINQNVGTANSPTFAGLTVAGSNATIYRDIIVNGGASGNFGNRIIVGGTATTYTYQDTTLRPTVYLNGNYPVLTLNNIETSNANHGSTIQFACNGLTTGGVTGRQIVIGVNGTGTCLDFGFSGGANGDNSSYNPHNGIAGYNGTTAMRLFSNGLLVGNTGTYPSNITSTSYALDVRGTGYFSSTLTVGGNISAANLSGTNTGDQSIGNGTITIAAGTGIGVGTSNTFTTNQSGATTVTVTNSGVTSNVAGTGISVSGATGAVTITNGGVTSAVAGTGVGVSAGTGAVTFSIGQAVGTANSPTFAGLTLSPSATSQFQLNSPSATQGLWIRAGYDTDGTATPVASANNIEIQSSGANSGTFSFVCGNTKILTIAPGAVNSLVALQQSGNQVLHAGNVATYALPIGGGTLTGGLSGTTGTFSGDLSIAGDYQIRNTSPTITFRDTNNRTAFIHVNSDIFYVLTGTTDSARGTWAIVANSRWPLEINLANNNATFGGVVDAISFTGAGTGLTGTAASLTAGAVTNGIYTTSVIYIGTTAITMSRSSAAQTLTGVNIDGYANYISAQTNPIGSFNVGLTRPKGASYTTTASSVTGAIKIKMPPGIPVHGMWKMTIKIYEYGSRGNGYTIECGCHLYPSTAYNRYQYAIGVDANIALTIRYGTDGTSGCIWIGENATTWSYPQIHVTEFSNGFNNPGNPDWNAGTWGVTIGTIDNSVAVDGPYTIGLPLASSATSATTAGSISGFNNPTTAATANTIVYRDSGGDIYGRYLFGSYVNSTDDTSSTGITYIMAKFGNDYHRSATAAKVATFISGQTMSIAGSSTSCTGNAATATALTSMNISQFTNNSGYLTSVTNISGNAGTVTNATFYRQFTVRDDRSDGGDYSLAGRPTGLYAITAQGTNGTGAQYSSLIHVANGSDVAFQIAGGYNSDAMYFRGTTALQSGTGYSAWRTVIHSGNIASQTVATAGSCTGNAATATSATTTTGNAGSVTYLPGRTDAAAYPVLWGAAYTNAVGTIAYSCAAVNIQSSTGILSATSFSGAGTGLTGTAASLNIGGNAVTAGGLAVHGGTNNEANKIVRTDGNGYINAGWINTPSGDMPDTQSINRIYCSDDQYIRYKGVADFKQQIGLTYKNATPRSVSTTDTNYWTGVMGWDNTNFNTMITWGSGFIDSWASPGNSPGAGYTHFVGLQTLHYTNGDTDGTDNYGYQLVAGGGVNSPLFLRVNWGSAGSWKTMLDSLNFNSYSPSLTGNGASGTWSINVTGNAGTATSAGTAGALITVNSYTVGNLTANGMTQLAGVKETYVAVAPVSNVVTLDLNAGTVFRMTYNSVISSFTLSNVTAGKVNAFTLISIASAGAGGINFTFTGYTLKWAGGTTPTATYIAGKFDVFSFVFDGTNWYGFTGGLNY
jgi:hypothetical protein